MFFKKILDFANVTGAFHFFHSANTLETLLLMFSEYFKTRSTVTFKNMLDEHPA